MLVIYIDLFSLHDPCQRSQAFFITETIVGFPFLYQFSGILQIQSLGLPLALYIWAHAAVQIRTFIMYQSCFTQCPVDDVHRTLHKTFLICILYTQNKLPARMLRNQVSIQRRPQVPHMHTACGAGSKSGSDLFHVNSPFLWEPAVSALPPL